MTGCTCPACAAELAWLRSLDPQAVALDRAAHATPIELRMIGATRASDQSRPARAIGGAW